MPKDTIILTKKEELAQARFEAQCEILKALQDALPVETHVGIASDWKVAIIALQQFFANHICLSKEEVREALEYPFGIPECILQYRDGDPYCGGCDPACCLCKKLTKFAGGE